MYSGTWCYCSGVVCHIIMNGLKSVTLDLVLPSMRGEILNEAFITTHITLISHQQYPFQPCKSINKSHADIHTTDTIVRNKPHPIPGTTFIGKP